MTSVRTSLINKSKDTSVFLRILVIKIVPYLIFNVFNSNDIDSNPNKDFIQYRCDH